MQGQHGNKLKMISTIRHNQKILFSGVLLIILGAWVPLVCRPCFAYSAIVTDVQQGVPHDHCKHDNYPEDTKAGYIDMYNPVVCGCNGPMLHTSTTGKYWDTVTRVDTQTLSSHLYLSGLNNPVPELYMGSGLRPLKPDRSCYHPLERNCIQLK